MSTSSITQVQPPSYAQPGVSFIVFNHWVVFNHFVLQLHNIALIPTDAGTVFKNYVLKISIP